MSDLKQYIKKRKIFDKSFAKNYDEDYMDFKVGVMMRALREEAGVTQEEVAKKMHTQKSAISRMESTSKDIRISTLFKFAAVLGKRVHLSIV